jgi:hypothetical protein
LAGCLLGGQAPSQTFLFIRRDDPARAPESGPTLIGLLAGIATLFRRVAWFLLGFTLKRIPEPAASHCTDRYSRLATNTEESTSSEDTGSPFAESFEGAARMLVSRPHPLRD